MTQIAISYPPDWVNIRIGIRKKKEGELEMPNKDGTGPMSQGPKSGRQMGRCAQDGTQEANRPRFNNQGTGRNGKACCNKQRSRRFFAGFQGDDNQKESLEQEFANLESQLNAMKERLNQLD